MATQAPASKETVSQRDADYQTVIERLSKASVEKHYEPYADIPWDDTDYLVDPNDPRWRLPAVDPLGSHPWYRSQPVESQAQIGLWRAATASKIGVEFENVLMRGLLTYAYKLRNQSPEFRYVYHETIEEGQHSLMFQEFVNRTGFPIRGMPKTLSMLAQVVPMIPRISTELFFVFVLGGEDPIDYVQRTMLRNVQHGYPLHPLLEKIIRIHVAEEARHISFAQHYLRRRVPRMNPVRRFALSLASPIVLGIMVRIMLNPPQSMMRHFAVPKRVIREAYGRGMAARAEGQQSIAKTRELLAELGLSNPFSRALWRLMTGQARP